MPHLDLVDEANWEDACAEQEMIISLEEAGLEEHMQKQPSHGFQSVPDYVMWFSDNEDARYEMN